MDVDSEVPHKAKMEFLSETYSVVAEKLGILKTVEKGRC